MAIGGTARFVLSAPAPSGLPPHDLPEIALIGRSNVGKSSLLSRLLGTQHLVRTSRTPGRTQLLNMFVHNEKVAYVDLPGYGYAKLSHTQRASMQRMIESYFTEREELSGVLLLLDARREEVSEADRKMAAFLLEQDRPVLLVATKADLLPKNSRLSTIRRLEKSFGVPSGWALVCSSKTADGQMELRARIDELCKPS